MGSGLCRSEKFRKFLTWAEPGPKTKTSCILCTAYTGKVLLRTNGTEYRRKAYTQKLCLFGSQLTRYQVPQIREPQIREKFWVPEIYFSHPIRRRKFAELDVTIIFQIRTKRGKDIASRLQVNQHF